MTTELEMKAKDYPLSTVEIACDYCGRYGRYRKERFVEIVGGETGLPEALGIISADCNEERSSILVWDGHCRPRYAQAWWTT